MQVTLWQVAQPNMSCPAGPRTVRQEKIRKKPASQGGGVAHLPNPKRWCPVPKECHLQPTPPVMSPSTREKMSNRLRRAKKAGETLRNEECSRKILCHLFDARWSLHLTCTGRAAPACAQLGNRKQWAVTPRLAQAHSFVTTLKWKEDQDKSLKHCKGHNGPEGWVLSL